MTPPPARPRAFPRALAAAATALLVLAAPASADTPERGDFDARPAGDEAVPPRTDAAQEALRERLGRFGLVSTEARTETPRAVAKLNGFLTGPSGRDGAAVALGYVRDHPRVFGLDATDLDALSLTGRTFSAGIEHLTWEQRYRGIPSSDTQLAAAVTGAGRLLSVTGPAAPDLAVPSTDPALSAERAYDAVRRSSRAARAAVGVQARAGGAEQRTTFADGGTASLVLYQDGDGARLAWRVLAPVSRTEVYDATVDATTGTVVKRTNRVDFAADALVYPISPEHPAEPISLTGWLDGGATTLKGPNVHAFTDTRDRVGPGAYAVALEDEVGPDGLGNWTFPLNATFPDHGCAPLGCTWDHTVPGSWAQNRKQSATQLFYLVNTFQAHLAQQPISFVTGGFSGDDPVLAQALDGADTAAGLPDAAHVNNASFVTLPDGTPGLLQTHLFSNQRPAFGDFDAANDASIVYHEYTHGMTNRLVTDAQGYGALSTAQAGAIDEGTADFFAMDFLVPEADDDLAVAEFRVGRYLDRGASNALRYQAIDCHVGSLDPLCAAPRAGFHEGGFTFADLGKVNGGPEIHSDGEIWAQTLWDLRQALGAQAARRIITQAMRLAPPEPSFLDMRNAILAAGQDSGAAIWAVFAARGMGYFASSDGSTDVAPVADDSLPPAGGTSDLSGTVLDEEGNAVAGADVGIAGHDTRGRSGLGPRHAGTTDENGEYVIADAPDGTYPLVTARRAGFREARAEYVTLPGGPEDFTLVRDWSSAVNGASIERFSGPDNTNSGCGPGALIDDRAGTVWGSDAAAGGQRIVIDLGAPIDISGVAIDPAAGCGDDPSAGLGAFALSGSTAPDRGFVALAPAAAFGLGDQGTLTDVGGVGGTRIRYVELYAKAPQSSSGSGSRYLDAAEIHVAKAIGAQPGPSTETLPVSAVSTRTARVRGTVIPHGATPVSMRFEYGPTSVYGSAVAVAGAPAGESLVTLTRDLTGLEPGTTYHYRFVATRGGADYPGGDRTFTTMESTVTPTPTPTATPTPTPVPPDGGPVVATAFKSTRLTADKRGRFKVEWTFGDAAPSGTATVRVVGKRRKRIAAASVSVQAGRTIRKTLRLNRAGRKMIKRGRSLRVRLELRLPGGGTLSKRVRLSRKR